MASRLLSLCLMASPASASFEFRRRRTTAWPDRVTTACSQNTKQKSMYVKYTFSPSLQQMPAIDVSASVVWEDLVQAPWRGNQGGVYAAWKFVIENGPSGYMGAQIKPQGGQFLFSVWDGDRWNGQGSSRTPKASNMLVWPLDLENCKRNCQDCGLPELRQWKEEGLTTGTQCLRQYPEMKHGGQFDIRLRRTNSQMTIHTRDYGNMPGSHSKLDEFDREVVGAVWEVIAVDVERGNVIKIGRLLFEGSGAGIKRLTVFDEMLGCTACIDMYHRETRYGPFLADENGSVRRPIAAERLYNKGSSCLKYQVTGNSTNSSVTFEGGPSTEMNFPNDGKFHDLWSGGAALATTAGGPMSSTTSTVETTTSTSTVAQTTTTTTITSTSISNRARMVYFSSKRCRGEPVYIPAVDGKLGTKGGTWGGLGRKVSRSRCKRLCLAQELCDFAMCKVDSRDSNQCQACSAFTGETCDTVRVPGQKFRVWKKTFSRSLAADSVWVRDSEDAESVAGLALPAPVVVFV